MTHSIDFQCQKKGGFAFSSPEDSKSDGLLATGRENRAGCQIRAAGILALPVAGRDRITDGF
jgi:hypothetical protein